MKTSYETRKAGQEFGKPMNRQTAADLQSLRKQFGLNGLKHDSRVRAIGKFILAKGK